MLVLSRHIDDKIMIGDDIVITVVDIRGDKVRLGIAAPLAISVHRNEVYEAIQREKKHAPTRTADTSTSLASQAAKLRAILDDRHLVMSDQQAETIRQSAETLGRLDTKARRFG